MKRLLKQARLLIIDDLYPDRWDNYNFIDKGLETINVDDIIGLTRFRVDDYNDDWTPKDKDDIRWLRLYNEIKRKGYNSEPINVIKTPDGKYFPDGDGNHRISVCKILGIKQIPAYVSEMVLTNDK